MVTSYSQYGEDLILSRFFVGQETGFFVEAGALDGIRLSTTYLLAQRGWKGLLFEPDRRFFAALENNRRDSKCFPWVLTDDTWPSNRMLHQSSAEGLSTIDHMRALELQSEGHTEQAYEVKSGRLFDMFKYAVPKLEPLDLLSLDCEGSTDLALLGSRIEYLLPRLVIVECFTHLERMLIPPYMENNGYRLAHVGEADNHFYVRDEVDVGRLQAAVAEAQRVP